MQRPTSKLPHGPARVHGTMGEIIPVAIHERRAEEKGLASVHDQHLGVQQLRKATDAAHLHRRRRPLLESGTQWRHRVHQDAGVEQDAYVELVRASGFDQHVEQVDRRAVGRIRLAIRIERELADPH